MILTIFIIILMRNYTLIIMKFYTTPYHSNLIKDNDRLAVFYEGILDYYKSNFNSDTFKIINISDKNNYINNFTDNKDKDKDIDIDNNNHSIDFDGLEKQGRVFDIGCGSGVLSYFASKYFKSVLAIDIDHKSIEYAKKTFNENNINNVNFICGDASLFEFKDSADLIICEMLDTALIDEEEVPVLNHVRKYLKDNGEIIPKGIINFVEPIFLEKNYIHYEDEDFHGKKPEYKILGDPISFSCIDFSKEICPEFETIIDFNLNLINNEFNCKEIQESDKDEKISMSYNKKINGGDYKSKKRFKSIKFNGLKITTFTIIYDNLICGPTPMLNPPLLIPLSNFYDIIQNDKYEYTYTKYENSISQRDIKKEHIPDISRKCIPSKNMFSKELKVSVRLKYVMGGGFETIDANIV